MAVMHLIHGEHVVVDRRRGTASLHVHEPFDERDLVHPYLAAPAGVFAQWHGRAAFHAGGAVIGGGAWGLLADRATGKTTTLAQLHAFGQPILSDDLIVVEGSTAFAGPRCLDLRPETARHFEALAGLTKVRRGRRFRLALPPTEPEVPFRGWVVIEAGDRVELAPVPPAQRFRYLHRQLMDGPHDAMALLELLTLPMWTLRRPRSWSALPDAADVLVRTLSG